MAQKKTGTKKSSKSSKARKSAKKTSAKKPAKAASAKKSSSKVTDDDKLWAFVAIFFSVLGFVIVLLAKRDNNYAMYYAKQSLVVFVAAFAGIIIGNLLKLILIGFLIVPLINLAFLLLWIIGMVYAFSGQKKPLPVVGKYADKLKI